MRHSNYTFTGLPPVMTFDSDATLVSVSISSFLTLTPTRTFTANADLVSASTTPSPTSLPQDVKARYVGIAVLVMTVAAVIAGIMICLCRTRSPRRSRPSATEDSDIALVDLESQRLPSLRFSSTRLRGIPHLPDSPTRGSMRSLRQSSSSLSQQLANALAGIQDGPLVSPGRVVPQGGRPLPASDYVQRSRALRSNPVSPQEVRIALNGPRPIPSAQVGSNGTLHMPSPHRPMPSMDRIYSWVTETSAQSRPISHHDEPRTLTRPPPVSTDRSSVGEIDGPEYPPPVPVHREYPLPKPRPQSPRRPSTGESSDSFPVPLQRESTIETNSSPPVPPHREFLHGPSGCLADSPPTHKTATDPVGEVSPVSSPSKTVPKLHEVSPESTPRTPRQYRAPYVTDGSSDDSPPSPASPLLPPNADSFDNVPLDTPTPTKAKRVSFDDGSRPGDE